jgi:sodium-dependent dicarboxylate transporter 2/3/5
MAIWWISEAVPIQWTACLPLVVLPFSGVHGEGLAANLRGALLPYVDPYIFLFLGGMGIAGPCSSGISTAASRWR